jgi:hypothetical protein
MSLSLCPTHHAFYSAELHKHVSNDYKVHIFCSDGPAIISAILIYVFVSFPVVIFHRYVVILMCI